MVFAGDSGWDPPAGPGDPAAPTKIYHRATKAKSEADLEVGLGLGPLFHGDKFDRRPSFSKAPEVIRLAEEAVPEAAALDGEGSGGKSAVLPILRFEEAQAHMRGGGMVGSDSLIGNFERSGDKEGAPGMPAGGGGVVGIVPTSSHGQVRVPSTNVPRVLSHRTPSSSRLPSAARPSEDDVGAVKMAFSDRYVESAHG